MFSIFQTVKYANPHNKFYDLYEKHSLATETRWIVGTSLALRNPLTGHRPVPGVLAIYNSAVRPYEGAFLGVFRGDRINDNTDSFLWNADCIELFVGGEQLDKGGPMLFTDRQILLGAGADNTFCVPNVAKQPAIKTAVVAAVDGGGYTLEAAIPWAALDITPKANMTLLFDIALDNSHDGKDRTIKGDTAQIAFDRMVTISSNTAVSTLSVGRASEG